MRKTVEVQMDAGMEARPIALMVQTANQFSSHLYLEMDGKHVNAKSIMGMMSLVLTNGVVVTIDAEGTDEVDIFEVWGEKIQSVIMLPGYTQNIINLSDTEDLVTVMYCNEVFNPNKPDTYLDKVER